MKFSEKWLQEWVNYPLSTQQLAEQLTMAGLEVESVEPVAGDFTKVVVGQVLAVASHPNAEKLRVCQVNVGQANPLNIVCGAANVRANLKVPVALDGAVVQARAIKTSELRGVTSQGMICSVQELGLQETSEGILELPEDAPLGKDFREWLQLNDYAIDVHVTPNRGDCLSIAGIAREVAVLNNAALKISEAVTNKIDSKEQLEVTVLDQAACPSYLGRIIRGINPHAKTPLWMQERLRRSGLRAIHPVVDITNYVLLELGQPLHAFDLAKISEQIIVRHAKADEQLKLLNEQTVELDEQTLIIADKNQPLAMAGIMGGLDSGVTSTTTDIFLESAFFNPVVIAGRARRYGLTTDASYRYERGVDPALQQRAIERATELLIQIVGGKVTPITSVVNAKLLPNPQPILLRQARIEKLLGMTIPKLEIENILKHLGMQITAQQDNWLVTPPSYRFDIALEADLIEEIVRIKGYESVPQLQPQMQLAFLPESESAIVLSRIRNLLVDKGYHEAITYSFIAPKLQQLIEPDKQTVTLLNPISADLSVMRTSLWPGLLTAGLYNYNRQQTRIRLFETGLRFRLEQGDKLSQEPMLAGLAMGSRYPEQWDVKQQSLDFFDIKAELQALFALTGCSQEFVFQKGKHSALHPGQCSEILRQGNLIGYLGALHPAILQTLDIREPIYVFEVKLNALMQAKLAQFNPISKFPAIRRDISFWIEASIPFQAILDCIRVCANDLLNDVWLFDVYQDKQKDKAKRSLAIGLLLQHPERTLVDEEVNRLMEKIITTLSNQFSISLRE
jgi:phenylalanyl-tRNA synthetase beta chain